MEIELVHGDDLTVSSSSSASLDSKGGALAGLTDTSERKTTHMSPKRLSETDGGGRLALSKRGRRNTGRILVTAFHLTALVNVPGNQDVLAILAVSKAVKHAEVNLGLVSTVALELSRKNTDLVRELRDRLRSLSHSNLDVTGDLLLNVKLEGLELPVANLVPLAFGGLEGV